MKIINPDSIAVPASNYSQGVTIDAMSRRVLVSGQCGVTAEGKILSGTGEQLRQAFRNIFAVVEEADLSKKHIVKLSIFLISADDIGLYREIRDEMLEGHTCASTLLIVSALAHPEWTCEIEAEACG